MKKLKHKKIFSIVIREGIQAVHGKYSISPLERVFQ
jgi:hypothetical protein